MKIKHLTVIIVLVVMVLGALPAGAQKPMYDRILPPPAPNTIVLGLDLSPDGRYALVAFFGNLRMISLVDTTTLEYLENLTSIPGLGATSTVLEADWSPDGSLVAVTVGVRYGYGGVVVFRLNETSGMLEQYWMVVNPGPRTLAWSPGGDRIAMGFDYYTGYSNLHVYYRNGSLAWAKSLYLRYIWGVAWSPDGKYLAAVMRDNTWNPAAGTYYGWVALFDAETGSLLWEDRLPAWGKSVVFAGDPPRLYVSGNTGDVRVYSLDGTLLAQSPRLGNIVEDLELLPDGRIAAAVIYQGVLSTYGGMGRLIVLDQDLNIVWEKRYCDSTVTAVSSSNTGMLAWGGGLGTTMFGYNLTSIIGESAPLPGPAHAIASTGGLTIVGGQGWLVGLAGGLPAWNISIPGNVTSLTPAWDGILVAYDSSPGGGLMMVGSDGTVYWNKTFSTGVGSVDAGPRLALAGLEDGRILFVDSRGSIVESFNTGAPVVQVGWDEASRKAVVLGSDRAVRVYEVSSGLRLLWQAPAEVVGVNPVLGGAVVAWEGNLTFTYWNGTEAWTLRVPGQIESLEWSPGYSRLALTVNGTLILLDYTGRILSAQCTFNASTGDPANYTLVSWRPGGEALEAATLGSSWVTTIYTGPYPPLAASLPSPSVVGGSLEPRGDPGVGLAVLLAGLAAMLGLYLSGGLGEPRGPR